MPLVHEGNDLFGKEGSKDGSLHVVWRQFRKVVVKTLCRANNIGECLLYAAEALRRWLLAMIKYANPKLRPGIPYGDVAFAAFPRELPIFNGCVIWSTESL